MKSYRLIRDRGECRVEVHDPTSFGTSENDYELPLEPSLKQRNHSPTGFEWGYGGSGPAQLALAILMDFTGKVPHPSLYQAFKFKYIALMDEAGGVIHGVTIQQFIDGFEPEDRKFMPPGERP